MGIGGTSLLAFEPSRAWTLSGTGSETATKTVYLQLVDAAGNTSTIASDDIAFDNEAPVVTGVTVNGGVTPTNELTLTVALTTSGAPTEMRVSEDAAFAGATWTSFASSFVHSFSSGDGVKTLYVQVRDDAGNTSSTASGTVTIDTTGPTLTAVEINGGATYASSLDVTVTTTAGGSPSRLVITEGASTLFDGAYSVSKTLTLAAGEGPRTLGVRVYDALNNASDLRMVSINVDTQAPRPGALVIDSGAAWSTDVDGSVTLTLSATDSGAGVSQMELVNSASCDFGGATPESYATTKAWVLAGSGLNKEGPRNVCVRFKDAAGNWSNAVSDAIGYDTRAPGSLSISLNGGAPATNSTFVSVSIGQTGGTEMQLSTDSSFAGAGWVPVTTTVPFFGIGSGDGMKTVYLRVRDGAGNIGGPASATILLDTTGPELTLTVAGGAEYTTTLTVNVGAVGSGSPDEYTLRDDRGPLLARTSFSPMTAVTLNAGEGLRTVTARAWDALGNRGDLASDTIFVDTVPPAKGAVLINAGAELTNDHNITYQASSSDSGSGIEKMQVVFGTDLSCDFTGQPIVDYELYRAGTLAAPGGGIDADRTICVRFRDAAGNWSTATSDLIRYDTLPPTGSIAAAVTRTNDVLVGLNLSYDPDVVSMKLSQGSLCAGGNWVDAATATVWTLSNVDGAQQVSVRYRDAAGNEGACYAATVTLDTTGPTPTLFSMTGNADAASGYSNTVNLTADATSADTDCIWEIAEDMTFAVPTASGSGCNLSSEAYTIANQVDGQHFFYLRFADDLGNVGPLSQATIVLDRSTPSVIGGGFTIDEGAYTSSTTIHLTHSVAEATEMAVVEGASCGSSWEPYSGASVFAVSGTQGGKTIRVRYRDEAGNLTSCYARTVTYDSVAPTFSSVSIAGQEGVSGRTANTIVTLTLNGVAGSPTEMRVANFAGFPGTPWQTFTSSFDWQLVDGDGSKSVYVQLRDAAGNESVTRIGTITLDQTPPDSPFLGLADIDSPSDGYGLSHEDVELAWTDPGDPNVTGFQLQRLIDGVDSTYVQIATPGAATYSHRNAGLTELGKAHNYRIRAADNLGLYSPWSNIAVARPITAVADGVLVYGGGQQLLALRPQAGVVSLAGASAYVRDTGQANSAVYPNNQYVWYRNEPFATERVYDETLDIQSSNADGSLVYNTRFEMPQNRRQRLAAGTDLKLMGNLGLARDATGALHACFFRGSAFTYGTNRSGTWVEVTVEATNSVGSCAIVVNETYAFIAYHDDTANDPKFWRRQHSTGTVYTATIRTGADDDGYNPSLALVGGSVYVFHYDATNTRLRVNYASSYGAGTWATSGAESAIHTAMAVASYGQWPQIVYDGTYWHLVMRNQTDDRLVYLRGTSAVAWSAPVLVEAGAYNQSFAVAGPDSIHVSYQKDDALYYEVGSVSGFSSTLALLRAAPSFGDSGTHNALGLDLFGQPFVVSYNSEIENPGVTLHYNRGGTVGWVEERLPGAKALGEGIGLVAAGEFEFAVLFEGAGGDLMTVNVLRTNSSTQVRSASGNSHGLDADVVVTADGRTHACSRSGGDLWYSRSNGGRWESYLVDAGASTWDCAIAVTAAGQVHIVYQAGNTLKHAVGSASTWTLTTVDASGTTGRTPRVHLDGAENLHVCYLSTSLQRIRYARRTAAGVWESPLTRSSVDSGGCRVGTWGSNEYPFVVFDDVASGTTVIRRGANASFTSVYPYQTVAADTTVGGGFSVDASTMLFLLNRADGGLILASGPLAGPFVQTDTYLTGVVATDLEKDANGNLHAVGVDPAGAQVLYLSNETGDWRSIPLNEAFVLRKLSRPRLALTPAGDLRVTYDSLVFVFFIWVEDGYIDGSIRMPLTATRVLREQTF